jgi:hypothetical protein
MIVETFIYTLVGISVTIFLSLLVWFIIDNSPRWSSAERRGGELLRAVLTSEQYCQLSQLGYLDIPSPADPQRIYRVPRAAGRVQVIENERVKASLCLQAAEWVPDVDMVVIHKLMIEGDEDTYLQKANRFMSLDSNL